MGIGRLANIGARTAAGLRSRGERVASFTGLVVVSPLQDWVCAACGSADEDLLARRRIHADVEQLLEEWRGAV